MYGRTPGYWPIRHLWIYHDRFYIMDNKKLDDPRILPLACSSHHNATRYINALKNPRRYSVITGKQVLKHYIRISNERLKVLPSKYIEYINPLGTAKSRRRQRRVTQFRLTQTTTIRQFRVHYGKLIYYLFTRYKTGDYKGVASRLARLYHRGVIPHRLSSEYVRKNGYWGFTDIPATKNWRYLKNGSIPMMTINKYRKIHNVNELYEPNNF